MIRELIKSKLKQWLDIQDHNAALDAAHEKIQAIADKSNLEFYKPRTKDHLGYTRLGEFRVRKRRK